MKGGCVESKHFEEDRKKMTKVIQWLRKRQTEEKTREEKVNWISEEGLEKLRVNMEHEKQIEMKMASEEIQQQR